MKKKRKALPCIASSQKLPGVQARRRFLGYCANFRHLCDISRVPMEKPGTVGVLCTFHTVSINSSVKFHKFRLQLEGSQN